VSGLRISSYRATRRRAGACTGAYPHDRAEDRATTNTEG